MGRRRSADLLPRLRSGRPFILSPRRSYSLLCVGVPGLTGPRQQTEQYPTGLYILLLGASCIKYTTPWITSTISPAFAHEARCSGVTPLRGISTAQAVGEEFNDHIIMIIIYPIHQFTLAV